MEEWEMYCTPEEAKLKWCSFAREELGDGSLNRNSETGGPSNNSYCLGPDCMAWRWRKEEGSNQTVQWEVKDKGYCGLVGGK